MDDAGLGTKGEQVKWEQCAFTQCPNKGRIEEMKIGKKKDKENRNLKVVFLRKIQLQNIIMATHSYDVFFFFFQETSQIPKKS